MQVRRFVRDTTERIAAAAATYLDVAARGVEERLANDDAITGELACWARFARSCRFGEIAGGPLYRPGVRSL